MMYKSSEVVNGCVLSVTIWDFDRYSIGSKPSRHYVAVSVEMSAGKGKHRCSVKAHDTVLSASVLSWAARQREVISASFVHAYGLDSFATIAKGNVLQPRHYLKAFGPTYSSTAFPRKGWGRASS